MKKIAVIGGGVLGSQIAFQSAYCGYQVKVWLLDEENIKVTNEKLDKLKDTYLSCLNNMKKKDMTSWCYGISDYDNFDFDKCRENINNAQDKIILSTDLEEVVKDAYIVIEAIKEDLKVKREFFAKLSPLLNDNAIIVTNSSTLLPSKMADSTNRKDKFLALHFANSIWQKNTAEVMKHKDTSDDAFKKVIDFAKSINMYTLPLEKEKSGYLLNSMLVPLLFSALDLLVNDVSDANSIDDAWTRGTGAPRGPLGIIDVIGLETTYNVVKMYTKVPSFLAPYDFKKMEKFLREKLDAGKTGKAANEGIFKY